MKILLLVLLILLTSCVNFKENKSDYTKISGNFNYTKNNTEKSYNEIMISYKKKLHETKNKKMLYYLNGNIAHNYDVFNRSCFITAFSSLGVEF